MSFSVSGLMSLPHEAARYKNLTYHPLGSATYFPDWGIDWDLFLYSGYQINIPSFVSYVQQESMRRGIVITNTRFAVIDFELVLYVTIDDVEYTFKGLPTGQE